MSEHYVEPSAEQRQAALAIRGWYHALIESGFTTDEALKIIGYQIGATPA
jgi:hypothetical protein